MCQNRTMLFLCWCCDQASDRREYGTSSKVIALKETSKRITEFLPPKKEAGVGGRKESPRTGKYWFEEVGA